MVRIVVVLVFLLVACGSETGAPSSAAPADPLTVSQALASDLDEPLLVQGLFIDSGDGQQRLCAAVLDSFPPQCGEPSVLVEGVAPAELDGARSSGDVTWVDVAQLLGRVQDGVMTVGETQL